MVKQISVTILTVLVMFVLVGAIKVFSGGIVTDTISELTGGNGVTIDGVSLKDSKVMGIYSYGFYIGALNSTYDTGISVNQGDSSASALLNCSIHQSSGMSTLIGLYALRFGYDGNNAPVKTLITGTDIALIEVSASNTLRIKAASSGATRCSIIMNR